MLLVFVNKAMEVASSVVPSIPPWDELACVEALKLMLAPGGLANNQVTAAWPMEESRDAS